MSMCHPRDWSSSSFQMTSFGIAKHPSSIIRLTARALVVFIGCDRARHDGLRQSDGSITSQLPLSEMHHPSALLQYMFFNSLAIDGGCG